MLKELKFVQGAVAKKDIITALTHFDITNGVIRAYNGIIALSSPIAFNIDCKPKAIPLVKAISKCEETVSMSMTPGGKLRIVSGPFRALIECSDEPSSLATPEGEPVAINGPALLQAFKSLTPFIGNDASRPWSNGVLLKGSSAFATNNVTLCEYWVGTQFRRSANIPSACIAEICRINEPPVYALMSENSMTFYYDEHRWIKSQLYAVDDWPDLDRVLNVPHNAVPINEEIFTASEVIKDFTDKLGRLYFTEGVVRTHEDESLGASYALPGSTMQGIYQREMLMLLKDRAKKVDFSTYPRPCLFFGDVIRGAIIGMKQ